MDRSNIYIAVALLVLSVSINYAQIYSKIEIVNSNPQIIRLLAETGIPVDDAFKTKQNRLILFVSEYEMQLIDNLNLEYKIIIHDWVKHYSDSIRLSELNEESISGLIKNSSVNDFSFGSMGGFYTLYELYNKLDELKENYPSLISEKVSIGLTSENRDIYLIKISDNPEIDEDEPEILFTGLHHAREPESMMQLIYFMHYLLENYGSDNDVTYLVNNREIFFVPVVNPDGYHYNESTAPNGGGMWRKNRKDNGDGSYGVDLNRNYGPMEYWNSPVGGSSTNPLGTTYRGIAPFSERETETIRKLLIKRDFTCCLNYHSYGNLLIFPYGAKMEETSDSLIFREYAREMTSENEYEYGTDWQILYNTRGNSDDYMYDGEIDSIDNIITMTPEVGGSDDGFWPALSRIIPLAEENLKPNLYFTWAAGDFINISSIQFDKEFYVTGDRGGISISLYNKGLTDSDNILLTANTLSPDIILHTDELSIDKINRRETIKLNSTIDFTVSQNLNLFSNPKIEIIFSSLGQVFLTDTITISLTEIADIVCQKGWNLISIPYLPPNRYYHSVFPSAGSKPYSFTNIYETVDSLTPGDGYWIKFNENSVNRVEGKITTNKIAVEKGWNLIGFNRDLTAQEVGSSPPDIISAPFYGFASGYFVADSLLKGGGYWVRVTEEGYLYYKETVILKDGPTDFSNQPTITIVDNLGCTSHLYLTSETAKTTNGELPPLPPTGVFDVRFSDNRYVKEIDDNDNYIQISGAEYPIKIKISGIDVRVKDVIDGSIVNKLLKDGDELTIANKNINRLQIEPVELPIEYTLYQNYPNPFNPSTIIKYEIPEDTKVRVNIYNSLGQKVRTIVDKQIEAGYHELKLNANQLASGVYFYRIIAGTFIDTKKMLLIK